MKNWPDLIITDGISQDGRFLPALQEGYFNPDELTFETLLAMSSDLASGLRFINLRNEPDGSWSELLTADPATVMAQILSLDLDGLELEFLHSTRSGVGASARFIVGIAKRLDAWFNTLNRADEEAGRALSRHIAEVIVARLATPLARIGPLLDGVEERQARLAMQEMAGLTAFWTVKPSSAGEVHRASEHQLLAATETLRTAFQTISHAITYLKEVVPSCLQDSLRAQTHNPAVGLLLTFLKLYPHAQRALNRFTQRHLHFYYDQVLKLTPRPASAGRIHLLLSLVPGKGEVFIPQGTAFSPEKDQRAGRNIYWADNDLRITDARVRSLCTLHMARDPKISPETELGYITGIHSHSQTLAPVSDGDGECTPFPLFGAHRVEKVRDGGPEAAIGFAVASPILLLKEGLRTVTISMEVEDPFVLEKASGLPLVERLIRAETKESFSQLLGMVFNRYLLTAYDWLTGEDKRRIAEKAGTFKDANLSADVVARLFNQDRETWFYQYFKNIFIISLTTAHGWRDVPDYLLTLPSSHETENRHGLICQFILGPEVEPIVSYVPEIHGGRWPTRAPVARFVMNARNSISPYSLFDGLSLRAISVETSVEGVRDLLVYNQEGQLDPSKPFLPFGPLPRTQSYCVVGNYEAARKNLVDVALHIEWGEIPRNEDGFRAYYKDYDTPFHNEIFTAEEAILSHGQWKPDEREQRPTAPLFETEPKQNRIRESRILRVSDLSYFKPVDPAIREEEFRFDQRTRDGFFKWTLISPDYAFGHGDYPSLLSRTLSENARVKMPWAKPIPNPPYTPRINRIALQYKARSVITFGVAAGENKDLTKDMVFHLHPFGTETIYPTNTISLPSLLPQYSHDGNLFIGLDAVSLNGLLTLFFFLREDSSREVVARSTGVVWYYLAGNRWNRLETSRVLSNTTDGFLSSGIVTLDLPDDIDRNNSVMPDGLFWVRVAANEHLSSFCSVYSVRTHALSASRQSVEPTPAVSDDMIRSGKVWRPIVSVPGLGPVCRIGPPFGERLAESAAQLQTRASERLRHKYRATMPWDYEQLILEEFPEVAKAKCFSSMKVGVDGPCPGHVLIVVVPRFKEVRPEQDFMPVMNASDLSRILEFIRKLTTPFVELDVRNPVYEWIQVRCTVQLSRGAQSGLCVNRLNQALNDYLSPWTNLGGKGRFGWSVRREEVEAHIRSFDFVDFVTGFSMLHVTDDEQGAFTLGDTARAFREGRHVRPDRPGGSETSGEIRPKYPWSLPMPLTKHVIKTTDEPESVAARVTGINDLGIGHTFIIGPKEHHG